MKEIEYTKSEIARLDEASQIVLTHFDLDFQIGDMFYDAHIQINDNNRGGLVELTNIFLREKEGTIPSKFDVILTFSHPKYNEGIKTYSLSEITSYDSFYWAGRGENVNNFEQDYEDLADQKITPQELLDKYFPNNQQNSQETGVMIMNKDILVQKKKELAEQKQFLEARAKTARELLDIRRRKLYEVAKHMDKFIKKLTKLIWSIELYLGIKEDLVQFGFGQNAPAEEPISFRQKLLYMDVEVGDPTDDLKGIDFQNIDAFDEWLMKFNSYWKVHNYEIMLPEPKGVVIFRVRKDEKQYYSENPYLNGLMNDENWNTYILIRNGENIFRITADIRMGNKLFPDQEELTKLVQLINGESDRDEQGNHIWDRDREKADNTLERYKLNMILFQGIIERTPCFPDNSSTTNIFAKDGYGETIKFIYDATLKTQLPTNVPTFSQFLTNLNSTLTEGNRVFVIGKAMKSNELSSDRFFTRYYSYDDRTPATPNSGLYQVFAKTIPSRRYTRVKGDTEDILYIKYVPDSERRWSWSDKWDADLTRKNRISWEIQKEDRFIINWDAISRDDLKTLEFYLYTRIGREQYLSYIPMLLDVFKEKTKEMNIEDDFIKLALSSAGKDPIEDFDKGIEAMEWWKLKNKWKRALTADDAKALRMITAKLKK